MQKSQELKRQNRKYQIFISSTFKDLQEHRFQAVLGIVSAGHMAVALETFPPEGATKEKVIHDAIDACQFYVIILGSRYGFIPLDHIGTDSKSYTEMEFDYAQQKGLKILAFIIDSSLVVATDDQQVPQGKFRIDNPAKYYAFRERLTETTQTSFHSEFTTASQIKERLFAYFSRTHEDVPGYIPELAETDKELLRIYAQNEIVRDVVGRLDTFQEVEPRLSVAIDKKKAIAQAFVTLHGEYIEEGYFSKIFIELGSTLTYIAKDLSLRLPKRTGALKEVYPRVLTNNAFAYLYLWLCCGVFCHPVPDGPPDEKYGGMYGPLTSRDRWPDYTGKPLAEFDPDAPQLIQSLSEHVFGTSGNDKALLLAAASGLQLSASVNVVFPKGMLAPENGELALIQVCRGFHGGSYRNKLFKRCMYLTDIPTIVFIHDDKIDSPIIAGVCHFFCDAGYTWEAVIQNHPLSIWVACDARTYQGVLDKLCASLIEGEWEFLVYGKSQPYPVVICHNAVFRVRCDALGIRLPVGEYNDRVANSKALASE